MQIARERPGRAPEPANGREHALPREIGGYDGPDPTRYGDWEHGGRCTDF